MNRSKIVIVMICSALWYSAAAQQAPQPAPITPPVPPDPVLAPKLVEIEKRTNDIQRRANEVEIKLAQVQKRMEQTESERMRAKEAQMKEAQIKVTQLNEVQMKETQLKLEEAKKRMEEAVRDVTRYSTQYYTGRMPEVSRWIISGDDNQGAMLGIHIEGAGDRKAERLDGVNIIGVTPNGPAEEAGLRSGDRIVALNGENLQWRDEISPSEQLLSIMAKAEPEQTVSVDYERDGKTNSVSVATEKLDIHRYRDQDFDFDFDQDSFDQDKQNALNDKLQDKMIVLNERLAGIYNQFRQPWHDLELVALTPKLGSYFNTDKGILVVSTGDNKDFKLEEGDVILKIGDREPKDPAHAMRILNSYRPGETVKLDILRERRKKSIEIEVKDARKDVSYRMGNDRDVHVILPMVRPN